jgi:soluble lytic murein transglycosylase-like protein
MPVPSSLHLSFEKELRWFYPVRGLMGLRAAYAVSLIGLFSMPTAALADIYLYRAPSGALKFSNAPAQTDYEIYLPTASNWYRYTTGTRLGAINGKRRTAFDKIIRQAAYRHGVDESLVKAVIRVESDFRARAVSPAGALGLMQLMPATARRHRVTRVFEPSENVDGGVRHLRFLIKRYKGNVRLALAAYNAGEGAVDKYNGIPPYAETVGYVERVLGYQKRYLRGG